MGLPSGTRLGPYEVLDLLGAGGMGEVYRARDSRLDRLVALKVLPEALAADAPSRVRFEREARAISALSHPHICALHDVGRQDDTEYLVLELLEGETLAARLARGGLPLSQVLRIGGEIAEALAAAHRLNIVHRDLKPGNVMLTPTGVKLLDFGLAKPAPVHMHAAVTGVQTGGATAHGTIVGTLQYMAPEQAQGLDADARSDIFALGAILHEMATGTRAFDAQTHAGLIAKLLETDPPPVSTVVPLAPPVFDQLVQRCLAKEPADRWQSAHDLALQLRWLQMQVSSATTVTAAAARPTRRSAWLPWAVAAVAVVGAAAAAFVARPEPAAVTQGAPMRFDVPLPRQARLEAMDGGVISPDGRLLAYGASLSGRRQLFRLDLASQETTAVPGTEGATLPFWSPDSRMLAFFASGALRVVPVAGGSPRTLASAPFGGGGSWAPGVIVFVPTRGGAVHRVPDTGGAAVALDMPSPASQGAYVRPSFLPDGRRFLVWEPAGNTLSIVSLDRPGALTPIETTGGRGEYAAGHLFYRQGTTLGARPFDAARLAFTGEFTALADTDDWYSVSRDGLVVYRSEPILPTQLTWFDRSGRRVGTVGEPGYIGGMALAPSGRRAAIFRDTGGNTDLWNVDLTSGIVSRLTTDPALDADPAWSPDERMLAFTSRRSGLLGVYLKHLIDGREEPLTAMDTHVVTDGWTPSGDAVIVRTLGRAVYEVPVKGDRTARLLADTPWVEDETRVSPDGRWIAFNSDESGRWEVYVASYPGFTSKQQLSPSGGVQPQWRGDGRELFYLALDGSIVSVPVQPGPEFAAGTATPLFQTRADPSPNLAQYGVTRDGARILALESADSRGQTFTFLLNRVPRGGR
jgi:eukaryotic-like serine/threonine-protein kinase